MTRKMLSLMVILFFVAIVPLSAKEVKEQGSSVAEQSEIQPSITPPKQTDAAENQKQYELDEIVVRERRIRNVELTTTLETVTSTQITGEDIEIKSDKVLKDVLYQVPGIQVSPQRKGTTQFYMRGYDMSKIAILVDDIPLIDSFTGSMDIDNIGLLDISEIIVTRGTTSALYGTKGAVGSINLIRKEPTKMYTNASAEYGQEGNYVASISHGAPIGDFYYYLSAMYDKSNGYTVSSKLDRKEREEWLLKLSRFDLYGFSPEGIYAHSGSSAATYYLNDTGIWDHISHEKYKFNSKIGYHVTPDFELGATLFYNDTEMENSNYFTDMRSMYTYNSYTKEKDWRLPDTTYILRNTSSLWPEYNDYALSPYLQYEKGKLGLKANMYYYNNSNTFLAFDDPMEYRLAYNRDVITMTWSIWTSNTYGFNIYPSWEVSSWNRVNLALSYYLNKHKEEDQAYNEQSTQTIEDYGRGKYETLNIDAGYLTFAVEDEMQIKDNVEVVLGVSFDGQDIKGFQKKSTIKGSTKMVDQDLAKDDSMLWGTRDSLNPVINILYEPIKDFLKLRAAASQKMSFPTLQAYTKTMSPYLTSSDPDSRDEAIRPEKMLNANLGYELSFFDKQLVWGADCFYSKYDDKITRIYITKSDEYIYRNIDAAEIYGAESSLSFYIPDVFDVADVNFSSTYTYMFSRNQAHVDDSFINKGSKLEKLPEHKLTFDLRANFKTDTSLIMFGNFEYNQIQYTMKAIPKTTSDFSTWFFHAQKLHNPLKIDFKLSQKILKHYEGYVLCKNILDDYNADPFNPGPGRTLYAGLKASF